MKLVQRLLRRKLLVVMLLAVMVTGYAQNKKYVEAHQSMAQQLAERFGIPYKVIMGIAIVESSSGQSKASKRLNNHFGMTGRTSLNKTVKYHTRYKCYSNDSASFIDFCEVVSRKAFYPNLKNKTDVKEWIRALSMSGYSEMPKVWENRVMNVISSSRF